MGQVQTSQENQDTGVDGRDGVTHTATAGEAPAEAGAASEATDATPPEIIIGHQDSRSPPQESPLKDAIPPSVELGDIAVKERRSNLSRKPEAELTPTAPAIRQAGQERIGGSGTERRRHPLDQAGTVGSRPSSPAAGTARASTPIRLPPLGSPQPGPTDLPASLGGWPSEHQSPGAAPRHLVVVGGSRTWAVACTGFILGCLVGVVVILVYGTAKSMGHQRRVIDDFFNWTLVRLRRAGNDSYAGNSSDATLLDVLHSGILTQGAANVTVASKEPPGK